LNFDFEVLEIKKKIHNEEVNFLSGFEPVTNQVNHLSSSKTINFLTVRNNQRTLDHFANPKNFNRLEKRRALQKIQKQSKTKIPRTKFHSQKNSKKN
jgi:hypothetical protein